MARSTGTGPFDDASAHGGDVRRRRVVCAIALVVGGVLIATTLHVERGSIAFYVAGYALAVVWFAAGVIGPRLHLAPVRAQLPRNVTIGVIGGGLTFGLFVAAEEIGRHWSALAGPIDSVLARTDAGSIVAVLALALVNAIAEEVFFRGVVVEAISDPRPVVVGLIGVVVYVAFTAVGGNVALVLAAILMGAVFALERHVTRNLVAPIVTHLVWSTLIVLALPR